MVNDVQCILWPSQSQALNRIKTRDFVLTHFPVNKMAAFFADGIFACIFMNEKFCISFRISLKFVPRGPIDNKSALVKVMAWSLTGDMNQYLPSSLMHIYGTSESWIECMTGDQPFNQQQPINSPQHAWAHRRYTGQVTPGIRTMRVME